MEKTHAGDTKPAVAADGATQTVPPKRSPGHRGADVRDTVAEMAAKAQEISQEAGSKMAAAMKDVISAAAGLSGFAIESARDLVQYMVRRGQMTQEEADKLIREADDANAKRKPHPVPPPSRVPKPTPPPSPYIAPIAAAPIAPAAPAPEPRRAAAPAKRAHAKPKPSAKSAPKKKRPAARAKPKPSAKAKKSAKRR
jgi:polyhydroxyalkanoate synthesis regulator phasin